MLNLTNYTFNDTLSKEKTYVNGIEFFLLNFADYFPYTFLAVFSTISGIIGKFLFSQKKGHYFFKVYNYR